MKKWKLNLKKIIIIVIIVLILALMYGMFRKIDALTNQLTYLQDSTSVILSDMTNLQSNIEKTLQEEASMVEDYSIAVESLDFANRKYKVNVSVVPKEYTDKTEVSIFFGTKETTLRRGKYAFTGSVDLPLNKDFDGNITFLISNGRKKTTEVLNDYQGLDFSLDQVLLAKLDKEPSFKNGAFRLNSDCDVELSGLSLFTFQSLELVTMLDEKQIDEEDLLAKMNGADSDTGTALAEGSNNAVDATESSSDSASEADTIEGVSGIASCTFTYEMPETNTEEPESEAEIPERQHIRVCVRAKTTDGYRFEYTVFEGDYLTTDKKFDRESFQWNTKNAAYDRNGNELDLDAHEIHEDN